METLASLMGAVAMAAPLDAPPPPQVIVVPAGYVVRDGGKGNLVLEPLAVARVAQPQPVVVPFRPVYQPQPVRPQNC